MLIHTAIPSDEVSKYCFPIKLFEYMATGKPVVSVRTPGISDEYFEYVIEIKNMEKEPILNAIQSVMNMSSDERLNYGQKARQFIVTNKNQDVQAKKLINFIKI